MASRTITILTDDIDGSDADETVTFTFKGTPVRDRPVQEEPRQDGQGPPALHHRRPHRAAADAPAPAAPPAAAPTKTSWPRSATWARANGHQVSDRGRISTAVQEAYHPSGSERSSGSR